MTMMLIHALQDDRLERAVRYYEFNPDTILWHHYWGIKQRWLTDEEMSDLQELASQFDRTPRKVGITDEFRKQIHILEWRSALRWAGLEGSMVFTLTEKVLDQALNGEPQARQEAIRYLELLENDICLIAETKPNEEGWFKAFLNLFTSNANARAHELELQAQRRSILINGFGAQGETLAVRNAALDALMPTPPPVPNGTCHYCRCRAGREYKFDYGRLVGGFTWSTPQPASVKMSVEFHKYLGSFDLFFCGRCKWKYVAKHTLIAAFSFVLFGMIVWLLLNNPGDRPTWSWLILLLIAGVASLISLYWMVFGGISSVEQRMIKLGTPKNLGVDLVVRRANKEFWTWVPDERRFPPTAESEDDTRRIPCVRCGAMILLATAARTGGLCGPCKKIV
ncbi:MAG: hypothetical protein ACREA9_10070 [Pyrinomonadaceae bacterium]